MLSVQHLVLLVQLATGKLIFECRVDKPDDILLTFRVQLLLDGEVLPLLMASALEFGFPITPNDGHNQLQQIIDLVYQHFRLQLPQGPLHSFTQQHGLVIRADLDGVVVVVIPESVHPFLAYEYVQTVDVSDSSYDTPGQPDSVFERQSFQSTRTQLHCLAQLVRNDEELVIIQLGFEAAIVDIDDVRIRVQLNGSANQEPLLQLLERGLGNYAYVEDARDIHKPGVNRTKRPISQNSRDLHMLVAFYAFQEVTFVLKGQRLSQTPRSLLKSFLNLHDFWFQEFPLLLFHRTPDSGR